MFFLPVYLDFQKKCIEHPRSISSQLHIRSAVKPEIMERKMLFLKGKAHEQAREWGQALRHYTRLIVRYPDPVFLSLEAYSRLLDVSGKADMNFRLSCADKSFMMEIMASPFRAEDQLLLAREIYRCRFYEVSLATFSIGMANTRNWLSKNPDTYMAFRTLWHIERYAHDLAQDDLLEKSARALLKLSERLLSGLLKPGRQQQIKKIRQQTYIWLVRLYHHRNDAVQKNRILKRLISEFPDT